MMSYSKFMRLGNTQDDSVSRDCGEDDQFIENKDKVTVKILNR